ncbi:23S rRNA (guanosine(2251)-2'-O)-methyltransferase RlmB [Liquorilactobacillus vini]|uniref:tRNA rRNA methyltransferase n=1 Tax=Liquorilactobacillus vini DSM 20605 TaxID=1133569 RepID=A0A0R2CFQ3_9LACO|nr:23S rRNA (guanosine(2251)-2'-O)-methyltransferase RlmB [Liquorilactobacillus vini]KRM88836.1 tRNA rRNA methyltransferase [Liquorilactobacillus vini DSM 20605]
MTADNQKKSEFIIGRHPAVAALNNQQTTINKIFLQKGLQKNFAAQIEKLARERKIIISRVPKSRLDELAPQQNHQGIILTLAAFAYTPLVDLLRKGQSAPDPFLLILDNIEDPHNLGSIIRTADAAGVTGIIIPQRRAVQLTSVVAKTSTGAIEYVPVARVTNLVQAAKQLKKAGFWIFGTDMTGKDYRQWNAQGSIALIIGNEGKGISPLLKKQCDELLTIPMVGHVQSLNASVAASLLIYQGFTSRGN